MFTQQLPAEVFKLQREFLAAMGGKLDFVWAAKTLITEEVKELNEAYEAKVISDENLAAIFKETADVLYVVAHFYNVMPVYAPEVIDAETNQEVQDILDSAADIVTKVSTKLQIPLPLILNAYEIVHASNMSKLGDDGKPVRREDGKIMKGPNYTVPDMMPVVEMYKQFQKEAAQNDTQSD